MKVAILRAETGTGQGNREEHERCVHERPSNCIWHAQSQLNMCRLSRRRGAQQGPQPRGSQRIRKCLFVTFHMAVLTRVDMHLPILRPERGTSGGTPQMNTNHTNMCKYHTALQDTRRFKAITISRSCPQKEYCRELHWQEREPCAHFCPPPYKLHGQSQLEMSGPCPLQGA